MEQAQKQAYAKMIHVLFGGTLQASPNQITPEVAQMVDEMFGEICKCHQRLMPFAVLADGVANSVMALMPEELKLIFGNQSFADYLKNKGVDETVRYIKRRGINSAVGVHNAYKVLSAFYESWVKYTDPNRKLKICIDTARLNWRSKITIELSGW
ncbi:MAG: hypothetical protein Q4A62_03445 [Eikenella sp.]|nr:hypothetical protein [Eikenella sp.]